jgi:hypothetical protein
MVTVHPSAPIFSKLGVGAYRDIDVLRILEDGLSMGFDIFQNADWSSEAIGEQQIGEIDLAVVSPAGHLLQIEVKSASMEEGETELTKRYSVKFGDSTDIGRQVRRTHSALLTRPRQDGLHSVHIETLGVQKMTFHEACVEGLRRGGEEPDFSKPGVYRYLEEQFIASAKGVDSRWDLLVIDETQDFKPDWVEALLKMLNEGGKGYLLGDNQQQVCTREKFDIHDSVNIKCMDNFRSPAKVVEVINMLALTPEPVVSRSIFGGAVPEFHTYAPGKSNSLTVIQERLKEIVSRGIGVEQIVVLSYSGLGHSEVLAQEKLAGLSCKKPTGKYDKAGNALWSDGDLLTDTIHRFKGQSSPVVLLCEIDFEILGDKELRKLFVGLTRAQYYVECVLSERAAELLIARAG